MPLSEHERNVLDRLEQDFSPTPGAAPPWTRPTGRRRLALAGVGLTVGLLLMLLALVMDSAAGVALALVAYGVVTGCSAVLVHDTSSSRAALVQRAQSAPTSAARPWYLR